jgi:hypothetical protein
MLVTASQGRTKGTTYDEMIHASSKPARVSAIVEGQGPGGEGKDNDGQNEDGHLDVEEPSWLPWQAHCGQSSHAHGLCRKSAVREKSSRLGLIRCVARDEQHKKSAQPADESPISVHLYFTPNPPSRTQRATPDGAQDAQRLSDRQGHNVASVALLVDGLKKNETDQAVRAVDRAKQPTAKSQDIDGPSCWCP